MRTIKWLKFPHDAKPFHFPGNALATRWPRLHRGDCEPYPTAESLAQRAQSAEIAPDTVAGVQEAWRAFHCGEYQHAFDIGSGVGLPGFAVAAKAVGVYASYIETNESRAQELLLNASQLADDARGQLPDDPNAHYLYAYALGRYSQRISVVEALARGYASKIEKALTRAIKLEPKHADAHIALGLYHAEVVGKLGSLTAGLTYGASESKAVEHFKKALRLNPDVAIAKLEYAHGLKLINEDAHTDEIDKLLRQAVKAEPADAMELLDRERARASLGHSHA